MLWHLYVPTLVRCPARSIPLPTLADWLTDWVSCTVEFDTKSDFWDFKHLTREMPGQTDQKTDSKKRVWYCYVRAVFHSCFKTMKICFLTMINLFLDNDEYVSRQWQIYFSTNDKYISYTMTNMFFNNNNYVSHTMTNIFLTQWQICFSTMINIFLKNMFLENDKYVSHNDKYVSRQW